MATDEGEGRGRLWRLRALLRSLYHGSSPTAVWFRLGVIVVDLAIIAFFIAAPLMRENRQVFYAIDYAIAVVMILDLGARALAWPSLKSWFRRPIVWVDLFVLVTLLFPAWLANLGFLRVVRLWTLVESEFFWRTVGRKFDDTRWEEITKASVRLITFIFVVTGFVYASFIGRYEGISGWVDALYFTVTTLTTTGYGDISLPGVWGRLLSIFVMLVGVSLFIRLMQLLVRPHKVLFPCPACGLKRHDLDAVHCKACGELLNIPNDET
ncbi:MAG TPA: potassium channel family protein [Caulobacter sp.]|mgnify:CR=1 FL=1|nr:potassium channel family protein [Caulobacter sp.]